MNRYAYTLKAYATNARRHPSPCQKLSLIRDMVAALSSIHGAGLAHRDLSEVNIMVDEDPLLKLEDNTPRPWVRVIDFGKSVFVEPGEVKRWSMKDHVSDEELALLPLVILPPDHGYKLYRYVAFALLRSTCELMAFLDQSANCNCLFNCTYLIDRF